MSFAREILWHTNIAMAATASTPGLWLALEGVGVATLASSTALALRTAREMVVAPATTKVSASAATAFVIVAIATEAAASATAADERAAAAPFIAKGETLWQSSRAIGNLRELSRDLSLNVLGSQVIAHHDLFLDARLQQVGDEVDSFLVAHDAKADATKDGRKLHACRVC